MATSKFSQGFECEFVDTVPEELYCKKCNLVARRVTITDCCGESFCQDCITNTKENGNPCPKCLQNEFAIFKQVKNQKQICSLQVYCSMKVRGCEWSGPLEHLDSHLDPDQDNCQCINTSCPLNCHQIIQRNQVIQHVAQHCAKRPHVCQYCNFKATYEKIVDEHLAECKYVPLQCPNRCGASFERDFEKDHMKMCRLEKVECEFKSVGCNDQFNREDKEGHTRQNSLKHLSMTASLTVETKEQLQLTLSEQNKNKEERVKQVSELETKMSEQILSLKKEQQDLKVKAKESLNLRLQLEGELEKKERQREQDWRKLTQIIEQQGKDIQQLKERLAEQKRDYDEDIKKLKTQLYDFSKQYEADREMNIEKFEEQKMNFEEQKKTFEAHQSCHDKTTIKVQQLEAKLKEEIEQNEAKAASFSKALSLNHTFSFKYVQNRTLFSPGMYTHVRGYRFCISMHTHPSNSKFRYNHEAYLEMVMCAMPGLYDAELKWPVKVAVTLELNKQSEEGKAECTATNTWERPTEEYLELQEKFERIQIEMIRAEVQGSLAKIKRLQQQQMYGIRLPPQVFGFMKQSETDNFLVDGLFNFKISKVEIS